jgi:site-specific recombinase XerD
MTPAKTIATEGASRQKIRVYEETVGGSRLIRVRWRENGKRFTRSWPYTADNKATAKVFAKGIAEGRNLPTVGKPLALRELWERYAEAEFPHLRPKSKKLYREYWSAWEIAWGREFMTDLTTLDMANQFRAALTKQGMATSTIRHSLETVKMVYRWGKKHKLIPSNELAEFEFKIAKEDRKAPPPEYSDDEAEMILAKLDPTKATQWRAWAALSICRLQGIRQTSALHLQWLDIDGATIIWRAPWDKNGKEWTQPIRRATYDVLATVAKWQAKKEYTGPWVIPSGSKKNKGTCYTLGALYQALRGAESRAGVKHLRSRGGHGLRRLLAGDVNAATGDPALAMLSIGDDVRQAHKYIQKRDDRVAGAFALLDEEEPT